MADDIILETRGLTKEFKGFVAVKGVDLQVRRGTIHALIGPNGAGKTTCFNLLTHFLTPTRGQIFYKGSEITGSRPAAIARMGLVRSFQISAVFPAFDRARERAHRVAAKARPLARFLALGTRSARARRAALRADSMRSDWTKFASHARCRAAVWQQARARDRDHAWRSIRK